MTDAVYEAQPQAQNAKCVDGNWCDPLALSPPAPYFGPPPIVRFGAAPPLGGASKVALLDFQTEIKPYDVRNRSEILIPGVFSQ